MNVLGNVNTKVSLVKDPFKSDKIECISIFIRRNTFSREFTARASVDFKNGNTEGSQKFEEKDFETLYTKIKTFIETL